MNDLLSDLYNYICENAPSPQDDPEYRQAIQAYMEIEEKVKEKIGAELLSEYQKAEIALSRHWDIAVFHQTLRFSHAFLLEVLG